MFTLVEASSSVSDDSSFVSRSDCLKIAISLTYHLTEVNRSSLLLMRDLMAAPLLLSAELMNLLLSGVADRSVTLPSLLLHSSHSPLVSFPLSFPIALSPSLSLSFLNLPFSPLIAFKLSTRLL